MKKRLILGGNLLIIVFLIIYIVYWKITDKTQLYEDKENDVNFFKYQQELNLKKQVDNYLEDYVYNSWIYFDFVDDTVQNLNVIVVYNNEIPEDLKKSMVATISENYSLDEDTIDIDYIDYDDFINH